MFKPNAVTLVLVIPAVAVIVLMELQAHHAVEMEDATYSAATVMVDADNSITAAESTLKRDLATILRAKASSVHKFMPIFSLSWIPTKMEKSTQKKLDQERTPQSRIYQKA
jgi:hypothetical protein